MQKTFKRETAGVMLLFLGGLFITGIIGNEQAARAAEFLTLPIFTFAAGAFGIDAFLKQGR